ncbi:MAG TPA: hypothetical protein VF331_26525 [Polyangiales bacterium]
MATAYRNPEPTTIWPGRLAAAAVTCALALICSQAHADIHQVGDHPKYGVELEPHLVYQWADQWWWDDDGVGLGLRASIPLIADGPVKTINNNLALSFGLDWAHFDYSCGAGAYSCSGNDLWVPVVVQWNFFLSDVVSLFPELGLALQHSQLSTDLPVFPGGCAVVGGLRYCSGNTSHTRMDPVLWLGARFMVSRGVALTLRLGTPSLLFGVSFLL